MTCDQWYSDHLEFVYGIILSTFIIQFLVGSLEIDIVRKN